MLFTMRLRISAAWLLALVLILGQSCWPTRHVTPTPKPNNPKPQYPTPVDLPKPDNNPKPNTPTSGTGQPNNTKPDTTAKPDLSDKGPAESRVYEMAFLLPFYTEQFVETEQTLYNKTAYATDFWAGATLALEQLEAEGVKLKVNIYDSQAAGGFESVLAKNRTADVIVGPAEKDKIETAAAWAETNKKTVVSMFVPTGELESQSSWFVQLNPSLRTHCEEITKTALRDNPGARVVLMARASDSEPQRFEYCQTALTKLKGSAAPRFTEVSIDDATAGLTSTNLSQYFVKGQTTVVIVPSWQEAFVSALLRRIDLDRKGGKVVVYGMPQWSDFTQADFAYFDKLNVHLSSAVFADPNRPELQLFQQDFFLRYGKAPNKDAMQGYDTALLVGRMVRKYGPKFQEKMGIEPIAGIQSEVRLVPRKPAGATGGMESGQVMKFENNAVFLLHLDESRQWVPLDK
jgi:ABC-type branched-subunit amino acid transport system substrate-binding protein